MRKDIKAVLTSCLALAVIAGGVTAALAGTNTLTKDTIAARSAAEAKKARLAVIAADDFRENTVTADGEAVTYYEAVSGGKTVGYVFTATVSGKASGMVVLTGVSEDGKVTGVTITENNETAGYVDKVTEGGLLDALEGKTSVDGVDAVAHATKSSTGVKKGVAKALAYYQAVKGGAAQ